MSAEVLLFPYQTLPKSHFSSTSYMGQRLNDLLCTLHLFHLLGKDVDPSSKPNQPSFRQQESQTYVNPHRSAISVSPLNRRKAAFHSFSSRPRRKQPPLKCLHLYRPIPLQQIQPDPRPVRTCQLSPVHSPHTPPTLVPQTPPGTLFIRAVHHSPRLKHCTYSPVRVARVVSEVKREQEAKERRFEAIMTQVKEEFRLNEG